MCIRDRENTDTEYQLNELPNTTLGSELLKDYNALNFSLRSHPMALLRHILNTKY